MKSDIESLSIFGLGKLGCPMTAVFAEAGYTVFGCDVAAPLVNALRAGECPYPEPGLADLLKRNSSRISFTSDAEVAVAGSDASFIIVPTPSDDRGVFTNRYVLAAIEQIGEAVKAIGKPRHLVVVTSTVMPGSTMGEIKAALEQAADRPVGQGLGLCYSPEFIALGSVIRDMQKPDLLLIGQCDEASGAQLETIMRRSVTNSPTICRMAPVNAEIAKLSLNCFVTMKISFANMLAELCEKCVEGDATEVTRALGADTRIGPKYLKPGLAFGGPCFPRDNTALLAFGASVDVHCELPAATVKTNDRQVERTLKLFTQELEPGSTIGILGLSYKSGTPVVEKSHALLLAEELICLGYRVVAFDPLVFDSTVGLSPGIRRAVTIERCVSACDGLFVADPTVADKAVVARAVAEASKLKLAVDCWRCLEATDLASGAKLFRLGRSDEQVPSARLNGAA